MAKVGSLGGTGALKYYCVMNGPTREDGLANESMNNGMVKKENNEAKKRMALPAGKTGNRRNS
jgi:hypothetical protein